MRTFLTRIQWQGSAANNALSNFKNCSSGPASAVQYITTTATTAQFFFGLDSLTFSANSATSQVMAQSAGIQNVFSSYYMTGQTSGLYTFGAVGYETLGANPVAQFVGSFRWSITPTAGGISLSLTNTTSFRSLMADAGPQWPRVPVPTQYGIVTSPMGNTHQTYNISSTRH